MPVSLISPYTLDSDKIKFHIQESRLKTFLFFLCSPTRCLTAASLKLRPDGAVKYVYYYYCYCSRANFDSDPYSDPVWNLDADSRTCSWTAPYQHVDEPAATASRPPPADQAAAVLHASTDTAPPLQASPPAPRAEQRQQVRSTTKCRVIPIVVSGQSTARLGQLCFETADPRQ